MGGYWNWMAGVFVFGILTIIDNWIGLNPENVSDANQQQVENDKTYRMLTYLWAMAQTTFILWAAWVVGSGKLSGWESWAGFTIGSGLVTGGIGITVAHELGHKKSSWEKFLSKLLLMQVSYMHFYVEHNRGHHVLVATPEDPATARKGQTFYSFWIRSVFEGYIHAWQLENESLKRKGKSPFSFQNPMIAYALLPIIFCAVLTIVINIYNGHISYAFPIFFIAQSITAFSLLEAVNYIEHYGIVRKLLADGRYERVNPFHSWNTSHKLSNYYLFQLQRHSDHHVNAIKRYQTLNHYDESPQLPFGYPTMTLIALFPPLWFRLIDPLLDEWKEKVYLAKAA